MMRQLNIIICTYVKWVPLIKTTNKKLNRQQVFYYKDFIP